MVLNHKRVFLKQNKLITFTEHKPFFLMNLFTDFEALSLSSYNCLHCVFSASLDDLKRDISRFRCELLNSFSSSLSSNMEFKQELSLVKERQNKLEQKTDIILTSLQALRRSLAKTTKEEEKH